MGCGYSLWRGCGFQLIDVMADGVMSLFSSGFVLMVLPFDGFQVRKPPLKKHRWGLPMQSGRPSLNV
jgi:hypothetical protein